MLAPSIHAFGPAYQQRCEMGQIGHECCLCGRPTDQTRMVRVNVRSEIIDPEADILSSDDMGLYPIGPECAKNVPAGWVVAWTPPTRAIRALHAELLARQREPAGYYRGYGGAKALKVAANDSANALLSLYELHHDKMSPAEQAALSLIRNMCHEIEEGER